MATQTGPAGRNRTGIQTSPADSEAMQDAHAAPASDFEDELALAEMRTDYIINADSVGSVSLPDPGAAAGKITLLGDSPHILLDKLGERLAFERTSARLYDALITKCDAMLSGELSMTIEDLDEIRAEETRHFMMLADAIESLGGDPTSQTPSGDLAGVESMGLVQVLNDPRNSIAQSLHAIMTAELSDKAGWETLVALADEHELDHMVDDFTNALNEEREHVALVQTWYEEAIGLTFGDFNLGDNDDNEDDGRPLSPQPGLTPPP